MRQPAGGMCRRGTNLGVTGINQSRSTRACQSCTFAHGDHELMPQPDFYKTQLCVEYFRAGSCKSGAGCRYAHDPLDPATRTRALASQHRAPTCRMSWHTSFVASALYSSMRGPRRVALQCPPCVSPLRRRPHRRIPLSGSLLVPHLGLHPSHRQHHSWAFGNATKFVVLFDLAWSALCPRPAPARDLSVLNRLQRGRRTLT